MNDIDKAMELVKKNITGFRKGSDNIPNYLHSIRVSESLKKYGFDDNTQLAGMLHDIVEDGGITLEVLKTFGNPNEVIYLVDLSTHNSLIEDKFERWKNMLERLIKEDNKKAWGIKLADISDNLLECHLMPNKEKLDRFLNKKCPVFIYYGNKYFGGTDFYNEFLERYFNQIKMYNQYFIS